ncbi:Hsp70 family protein, partial [Crocinitomicaceae bacterium]|nr:Hsp70 family protein [Crocinitomicaceae bacterium]
KMGRIKIDYGIDLGTTNSALALLNKGEIEVKNIDNSNTVPSCISYNRKGGVRSGKTALSVDTRKEPQFLEFKRRMGTDWTKKMHPLLDETVNAEELSSEILKKIKNEVTAEQFKSVVITVPAMFDMSQVAATKRAGEMAGFEQVEILMEPVAAAFNYGFVNNIQDAKFVVFDFGGGTFDAALVKAEGGVMSVVSSEGDNFLGGKDLDELVVNKILLPLIKEDFDIDNLDKSSLKWLKSVGLKRVADELKIKLGKTDSFDLLTALEELGEDANGEEIEIDKTFTRQEIHGAMTDIFMKAISHAKKLLEVNNLKGSDLSAFVLVGGPTQIPLFRELIEKEITKPDTSLNPMTAIAEGAALYASTFNNKIDSHGAAIGGGDEGDVSKPAVQLEVQYEATTVNDEESIGIKRKSSSDTFSTIISRSDGWESPKQELDDVFTVAIKQGKPNSFTIKLFDKESNPIPCSPNQFTIIPGTDIGGGAPIPYNIGMEVFDQKKGLIFQSFRGLEKDRKLPLTGQTVGELFNSSQLRPGMEEDKMMVPIYFAERDAHGSRSIINVFGDTIEISGMDVEKLVPANSSAEFTLKIDISQNMTLEVEFPRLDMDVITKTMAYPAKARVQKEQIDTLFEEIKKGINKLNKSTETVTQLGDFRSKQSFYNAELGNIIDGDYEKIFGDLRSFLLEIDIALENIKWPVLKKEVIDTLFDFDQQVKECVDKRLDGWEKDQSDLEHFTKQKEQLFNMPKPDQNMAEELIENIKSAELGIVQRHQGKELFTEWIYNFNQEFNSIDWKNSSIARKEIDRGLQLVNNGADKGALGSAVQAIVAQMKDPDVLSGGSGVSTGN